MSDAPWAYIEDIGRHEGETVTLKGRLYNKRSSGKLHFLQVREGTGTFQCVVFEKDVPDAVRPRRSPAAGIVTHRRRRGAQGLSARRSATSSA